MSKITREIVLDTETTGLDLLDGHRIVEIACVELLHHIPTGVYQQWYINPEREVPMEAQAIHGLSTAFLSDKPLFADIAKVFLEFIGDSILVIHNAEFDIKFINSELQRCQYNTLSTERVIDTVLLARRLFPGAQASLDALCRRFSIDNSERTTHSALLDAQLLSNVYLELIGGREPKLEFVLPTSVTQNTGNIRPRYSVRTHPTINIEELKAHKILITKLKNPLWWSMQDS